VKYEKCHRSLVMLSLAFERPVRKRPMVNREPAPSWNAGFLLFGNSVGNYVSVSVCETSGRWRHLKNAHFREGLLLTAVTGRAMSQNAFMIPSLITTQMEMSFEMLFGYARVSTDDQKLDLQHDALVHAGVERNRIFEDKLSGMKADRPGLASAMKAMRAGDVLVTWRLDRLGRSLKELITLSEELKRRGVQLRSITEGIDTTTIGGELLFHLFGAIAQFEQNLIRERTRAGLTSAKAKGRIGGRPPAMKPKDIAMAKALLADPDITVKEVAERLGVPLGTLYRHLPGGRSSLQAGHSMSEAG
jgi:DNA invertase Pin-like site-specific DNA recombinase